MDGDIIEQLQSRWSWRMDCGQSVLQALNNNIRQEANSMRSAMST